MTIFLWVLAGISFLYFLILLLGFSITSLFLYFWLALALGLGGLALVREHFAIPTYVRVIFWITAAACLVLFIAVESVILRFGNDKGSEDLDYLIVLGAQVRGRTVSLSLQQRLDEAYRYLEENPDTKVIVSGGQGFGEDVTEAYAMEEYLMNRGIDASRIIKEEASTSTEENLAFSQALMVGENPAVGIVTNDFHVFRAVRVAQKMGIENAEGIAAPSMAFLYPHYLAREFFAVVKYFLVGTI